MPSATKVGQTPSLSTFLKALKQNKIENSIELFIGLLKRRQIRNSRACALATTHLLLRVVSSEKIRSSQALLKRIRDVGRRIVDAQPREMAVGNVVRRILGVVREVAEQNEDLTNGNALPGSSSISSPDASVAQLDAVASRTTVAAQQLPPINTLFGLFQNPDGTSGLSTPPSGSRPKPGLKSGPESTEKLDVKAEVIEGIKELLDELEQVDTQIAEFALDHIHSNETILTHTSSQTVQKFLMTAAKKRKFTVIHAEAFPNDHEATHATILYGGKKVPGVDDEDDQDERWKPLTAMGIQVILIPDSAVFALMSRINKVIIAPHTVLSNGSLLAAAGASVIAQAAQTAQVPVVVLSGVYKLSPIYPFDASELIEFGDPGKVVPYQDGEFMENVDVVNPVFDWVEAEAVDLYVTNLGACAPSYLYRIVDDHYYNEDIDLA